MLVHAGNLGFDLGWEGAVSWAGLLFRDAREVDASMDGNCMPGKLSWTRRRQMQS